MKKGMVTPMEKVIIFFIVIAVLIILAAWIFKIYDFKELFNQLLESFK